MSAVDGVYVLELNDPGFYYVGQSRCKKRRVQQHVDGKGSEFCKAHGGVKCVLKPETPRMPVLTVWEQTETVRLMLKHGFDNVRGWGFVSRKPLNPTEAEFVRMLATETYDLCRACGRKGHFARRCTKQPAGWMRKLNAVIHEEDT
jgi:hypothetical protein